MRALVTGGTGFVGRHVVRELRRRGHEVVILTRGAVDEPGCAAVRADLRDELPEREMDADVFVHCAADIGRDPGAARALNVEGTRRLLAAACAVGARTVSLSTLSVYGSGPHAGAAEGELETSPESVASATRAEAEQLVLSRGGTVLRAALTYGDGDRWLIPAVSGVADALGIPDEFRRVRSSVIGAPALARAVAGCAVGAGAGRGGVLHLAHPEPANLVALAERLTGRIARRTPLARFDREADRLGLSEHQLNLLRLDHWYQSRELWERTGEDPGPAVDEDPAILRGYRAGG